MQRFLLLGVALLGIIFFVLYSKTQAHPIEKTVSGSAAEKIPQKEVNIRNEPANKRIETVTTSVFVPYWSLKNWSELEEYNTVIYFGVSVTEEGINRQDQGFANIQTFVNNTTGQPKFLTVRMLNTETNLKVLESKEAQKKIIQDVIAVSKQYGFDGVVLDLELSVMPFTDVKENISMFTKSFSEEIKVADLDFYITLYGDTYYRARPYDVRTIGNYADRIFIMAYDFHKSRGEPGPNFPLEGKKKYRYDFKQMIHDFSQDVPVEKLTVIFGMYGYDWILGPEGKPLTGAKALSLADMQAEFVSSCNYRSCGVTRDLESAENTATYIDEENYDHTVWFEDEESVQQKVKYLKEQGIGNISYWTWGYW